jgi:hypothetical protein
MKRSPLKRSGRLNPISKKRKGQIVEYTKIRKEYLSAHPKCQVCESRKADQIHHRKARWGERLNDKTYFLAVCQDCHNLIHSDPAWAYSTGYLLKR